MSGLSSLREVRPMMQFVNINLMEFVAEGDRTVRLTIRRADGSQKNIAFVFNRSLKSKLEAFVEAGNNILLSPDDASLH